jgi:hypothetical protein
VSTLPPQRYGENGQIIQLSGHAYNILIAKENDRVEIAVLDSRGKYNNNGSLLSPETLRSLPTALKDDSMSFLLDTMPVQVSTTCSLEANAQAIALSELIKKHPNDVKLSDITKTGKYNLEFLKLFAKVKVGLCSGNVHYEPTPKNILVQKILLKVGLVKNDKASAKLMLDSVEKYISISKERKEIKCMLDRLEIKTFSSRELINALNNEMKKLKTERNKIYIDIMGYTNHQEKSLRPLQRADVIANELYRTTQGAGVEDLSENDLLEALRRKVNSFQTGGESVSQPLPSPPSPSIETPVVAQPSTEHSVTPPPTESALAKDIPTQTMPQLAQPTHASHSSQILLQRSQQSTRTQVL